MNNLEQYLPSYYDGILETDELMSTENVMFDDLQQNVDTMIMNQYIVTMNEDGCKYYEDIFGIIASVDDTLEFRRQRIINRVSQTPPFTLPWLTMRLDAIIGVGKYTLNVEYGTYTITTEASAVTQGWAQEIAVTINKIKPCNMIYINKPLVADTILVNETVAYSETVYNYHLGTTWLLGQKPFGSIEDKGVVKVAGVNSITDDFLNILAQHEADEIEKVIVNGTLEITTLVKNVVDNYVTIEYEVPVSSGLGIITSLTFKNTLDVTLTTANVYVPITTDVTMKHTFETKEGA